MLNMFLSEAIALIEPKLCINHWKVLYKLCVFYVDRNSKMTTTAGHSFYIEPIGSEENMEGKKTKLLVGLKADCKSVQYFVHNPT
jgi:hypothetical protein